MSPKEQTPLKIGQKEPVKTFEPGDDVPQQHAGVKSGGKKGAVYTKKTDQNFDADWLLPTVEEIELPVFDAGLNIVSKRQPGYSVVNKFGRKVELPLENLPQDIWDAPGVYTGFSGDAPQEFEVFSTSPSDIGEVVIQYLPDENAEAYVVASVPINGTVPVATGVFGHRLHTARYNDGSLTNFNKGNIVVRHKTTPANVFCSMPIGRSQTACAAITVPANHTGYVVRLFVRAYGDEQKQIRGGLWIKDKDNSPRVRRPVLCSAKYPFEERLFGGVEVLAGGDVMVRIDSSTQPFDFLEVSAGFDIVFVHNEVKRIYEKAVGIENIVRGCD